MTANRPLRLAAVAAALALLFTACGREDEASDSTDDSTATTAADGGTDSGTDAPKAFINPEDDCSDYQGTKGIEGNTIKIGTVRPESGPYSIYDTVTKGLEAYVGSINAKGGVKAGDGKTYKLELVKADDAYDPAKTPGEVQRLVEQEGIFAMVGQIGTILGGDKVNIADMSLSRLTPGGTAYMVVRVDTEPSESARAVIKGHAAIKVAKFVQL